MNAYRGVYQNRSEVTRRASLSAAQRGERRRAWRVPCPVRRRRVLLYNLHCNMFVLKDLNGHHIDESRHVSVRCLPYHTINICVYYFKFIQPPCTIINHCPEIQCNPLISKFYILAFLFYVFKFPNFSFNICSKEFLFYRPTLIYWHVFGKA